MEASANEVRTPNTMEASANEVRIRTNTQVGRVIQYVVEYLKRNDEETGENKTNCVTLLGMGGAIPKVIQVAEIVKARSLEEERPLYQEAETYFQEIIEEYEKENGGVSKSTRKIPAIKIELLIDTDKKERILTAEEKESRISRVTRRARKVDSENDGDQEAMNGEQGRKNGDQGSYRKNKSPNRAGKPRQRRRRGRAGSDEARDENEIENSSGRDKQQAGGGRRFGRSGRGRARNRYRGRRNNSENYQKENQKDENYNNEDKAIGGVAETKSKIENLPNVEAKVAVNGTESG